MIEKLKDAKSKLTSFYIHKQFREASEPDLDVFGLWEVARVPRGTHTSQPGIKPKTFMLWGNTGNTATLCHPGVLKTSI